MSRTCLLTRSILAGAFAIIGASGVSAQQNDAFNTFKQLDSAGKMPKLNAFSALPGGVGAAIAQKNVVFDAKLTAESQPMQEGLIWRVFSPIAGEDGKLPLVASFKGGSATFRLAPGDYFVNCAFGRAGITTKLSVPKDGEVERQQLVLDAGGFVLNAVAGKDQRIPAKQLSFSIFSAEVRDNGDRALVMANVSPNKVVRLNAGTYHVVSEYGDINAVVRADVEIDAGKLTQVVLQHRAAQISIKLVSQTGGEAIADTAWSVLTAAGDVVNESVSAFSTMVLAEGEYLAVARNKNNIYRQPFTVKAGRNMEVEVLMRESEQDAALQE